ncbi:MAG: hypothetical protein OEY01_01445, partial [Desulfobulbaceae bacterium]|nr:hypothetical protein [Desulfobulbaceae bacterium]HIJ77956.1 hypothetical protein [Deltaproteobacteria bacterium]
MTNPPTTLIFCGWLKALTSRTRRTDDQGGITLPINRRTSIKDLIESFGVPHTEVGAILVDEEEVTFDHIVGHPKAITIMPLRPPVDVLRPSRLRPLP